MFPQQSLNYLQYSRKTQQTSKVLNAVFFLHNHRMNILQPHKTRKTFIFHSRRHMATVLDLKTNIPCEFNITFILS